MQTRLHSDLKDSPAVKRAADIIKSCVHCGFCTAHCPTYQLLGDERDGPRGRIYLIKQMLEENQVSGNTRTHLDRCLTCRACETVCPAGVKYGELVHTGRKMVEEKAGRPISSKIFKYILSSVLPYPSKLGALVFLARLAQPFMPRKLARKIPPRQMRKAWPAPRHSRKMLVLAGCAQSVLTPETNQAMVRVLDRIGISAVVQPEAGCCGAVDHHMGYEEQGLEAMRQNIDAWWPDIETGIDAIIISASACALQVKEYGTLFKGDLQYEKKAKKVSELAKDVSEVLATEDLSRFQTSRDRRIAVHCPCTLQHGQKGAGLVETILKQAGLKLTKTRNSHLCCGSAGTYSLLQPAISNQLLDNKIHDLTIDDPGLIVTSNIGCQMHIGSRANQPVKHWIELLAECE